MYDVKSHSVIPPYLSLVFQTKSGEKCFGNWICFHKEIKRLGCT